MRLLVLCHSFAPERTGIAVVAANIAREVARQGVSVQVATARTDGAPERCDDWLGGISVQRFDCAGNAVTGLTGEIAAFREFFLQCKCDLIVAHCAQCWTTDAILDLIEKKGVPFVLVSHGLSAFRNPAYKEYFDIVAARIGKRNRIVSLSARLEETAFCQEHGLPAPVVIPNGLDWAEWAQPALGVRARWGIGKTPWVVTVSNHSTVKNHPAFWNLMKTVHAAEPSVRGSIIGRGYRADKFGLGRLLGVQGGCWYACCVRSWFPGCVNLQSEASREEVVSAVKEADLLVITSSREAAPVVLLESMAAGIPWVSLRVGSVEDNVGGVVVDSAEEMAGVVRELLKSPADRNKLGAAGRVRADKAHRWERIASLHLELYNVMVRNV